MVTPNLPLILVLRSTLLSENSIAEETAEYLYRQSSFINTITILSSTEKGAAQFADAISTSIVRKRPELFLCPQFNTMETKEHGPAHMLLEQRIPSLCQSEEDLKKANDKRNLLIVITHDERVTVLVQGLVNPSEKLETVLNTEIANGEGFMIEDNDTAIFFTHKPQARPADEAYGPTALELL